MIRRIWRWLTGRADGEEEADDGEASRFVPSRLDASVRYAHGGSAEAVDRELADVEAKARQLDERRRER